MSPSNLLIDLEKTGNLIEAGFWIIFGLGLAIAGLRRCRAIAHLGLLSGTILCLFGVSDLVEASTGAWWRPWWLLVWKGTCLSGMVLCALKYRRISVREPSAGRHEPGSGRLSRNAMIRTPIRIAQKMMELNLPSHDDLAR